MKYKVIEREKLSGADFAAIIQFGSCTDAMAAAKAINESSETNTPGRVSEGNTGAFRVGKCVVFNAYHQACYDKFIKIIGSLDCSVESLAANLWDGMACPDCEAGDDMDAAIAYLSAMFPSAKATVDTPISFYFDYDGVEYRILLEYDHGKNNELHGGKLIVSNYDDNEPVIIDRHTPDVKGTLEKFFKKAKPAGDSPDSLAANLWDGMANPGRITNADRDAAFAYFRSMFPDAETTFESPDSFYFDYDGVEYFILIDYDRDENNELHGGKLIVRDCCNSKTEPLTIDRDTRDVKGTLENFFKKTKPAGDSPDSPDSPAEPSLMDRLDRLDAEAKKFNAEIKKIKKIIKK